MARGGESWPFAAAIRGRSLISDTRISPPSDSDLTGHNTGVMLCAL